MIRYLFQSTLPQRERHLSRPHTCTLQKFQSTLPQRERRFQFYDNLSQFTISIHAPTKGATRYNATSKTSRRISIHAPTKGATNGGNMFNFEVYISIHAPTKGATITDSGTWQVPKISIHAPTKGATGHRSRHAPGRIHFNPRSHKGSDWYVAPICHRGWISIHAPTKGATGIWCSGLFRGFAFQSTLPQRERRRYQGDV